MLQLPVISPVNSPTNRSLSPSNRSLFSREKVKRRGIDRFVNHDAESPHPKYLTGYTGHIPEQFMETREEQREIVPVVGYTGHYRGKSNGKLGRVELHRSSVSMWEKETVSDIIGIRTIQDDWEYVHEAASCSNFMESFPSEFHSPATATTSGSASASTTGEGKSEDRKNSSSSGDKNIGDGVHIHVPVTRELVDALNWVLIAFESRFKTSTDARKVLKMAFFKADPFKTGTVKEHEFIDIIHLFGVPLMNTDANWAVLSEVLRVEPHSDNLSYGRFLNILVPSKNPRKAAVDYSDYA